MANPVVRTGEFGGFKWTFRRFWVKFETLSGNFKVRYTANEHPFAYLLAGKDDSNIIGFIKVIYYLSMTLTTDQGLCDDIGKAIKKFEKRMEMVEVDETDSEEGAIQEVKAIQEYVEKSPRERRKADRKTDKRFKAAVKKVERNGKVG